MGSYEYTSRQALECENDILRRRVKLAEETLHKVEAVFSKTVTSGTTIDEICALRNEINFYFENR